MLHYQSKRTFFGNAWYRQYIDDLKLQDIIKEIIVLSQHNNFKVSFVFLPHTGGGETKERMSKVLDAENIQWLKPAVGWIKKNEPVIERNVLCHGDFHSFNVLMEGGRISGVLDWSAAHIGEPERDVTSTMTVVMAYGPLFNSEQESKWFAENYLESYNRRLKVDREKMEYYEAVNCIGYIDAMETGGNQETPNEVKKRLIDRFMEISGVDLHP